MVYESQTSFPEKSGERGILKQLDLVETDTFPFTVWTPPNDKRVVVDDIILSLRENSASRAIFVVQLFQSSAWEGIVRIGTIVDGFVSFNHAFAGKLRSDKGDGSTAMVRVAKPGAANTTNFSLKVVVIGREV